MRRKIQSWFFEPFIQTTTATNAWLKSDLSMAERNPVFTKETKWKSTAINIMLRWRKYQHTRCQQERGRRRGHLTPSLHVAFVHVWHKNTVGWTWQRDAARPKKESRPAATQTSHINTRNWRSTWVNKTGTEGTATIIIPMAGASPNENSFTHHYPQTQVSPRLRNFTPAALYTQLHSNNTPLCSYHSRVVIFTGTYYIFETRAHEKTTLF